jgi:DNA-binding PadR family transcriptional regulator
MGKHNRTLANRLLVLLAENGGAVSHQRVHDLPMSKAEIAQAIADTTNLVTVTNPYFGKTRHRRKVYTLTELGHARAYTLKPDYHPTRLTIPDWQAQLSEMIAGREPEGLQIALDRQDGPKWRAHEAARKVKDRAQEAKRAAKEKPAPKYPSAGRNRSQADLEARRQWTRSKGFTPRDSDDEGETEPQEPAPKQIPVEFNRGRYHVAPTPPPQYNIHVTPVTTVSPAPAAPADDYYASGMRAQSQALFTIHESNRGYDNSPKAEPTAPTGETRTQVMERARANGCVTEHAGLMFEGEEFGRDWKRFAVASKKKAG